MNRNPRRQRLVADINITPFTDVILVLLVIFMITTPLISQSGIKVNLPQAASSVPLKENKPVYISITNENLTYLNDTLVTRKELKEKMYQMYRNNPSLIVVLRSDKMVQFKTVVSILDALNELGINNLNIAATTE
jgi:TonB system transport protein ExbD (group 2)